MKFFNLLAGRRYNLIEVMAICLITNLLLQLQMIAALNVLLFGGLLIVLFEFESA